MSAGLLAFFIALFGSMALTLPVRALALRVGMVDFPGPRKVHLQPIPLLGGLAMYGGVMLAIIFAFDGAARVWEFYESLLWSLNQIRLAYEKNAPMGGRLPAALHVQCLFLSRFRPRQPHSARLAGAHDEIPLTN